MAKKTVKRSERAKDTWNEITGIVSVYGNTFEGKKGSYTNWSATIGKKNDSGEYDNYYLRVRFGKNIEEPDTDGLHQIDIENAFLSVEAYTNKDKERVVLPVLVITEGSVID